MNWLKKFNRHQKITPLGTVRPYSLSGDFITYLVALCYFPQDVQAYALILP